MDAYYSVLESLKIKDLNTFVTIADCGSVTDAAQKLYVAQPSLSRKIQDVENKIGQDLFVRKKDGLELTETGKKFYEYAQHVLEKSLSLSAGLEISTQQQNNVLRLGHAFFLLPVYFSNAIGKYIHEFPQSIPDIIHCASDQECIRKVIDKDVDIAITSTPCEGENRTLYNQNLEQLRCHVCVSPNSQYAGKSELSMHELVQESILIPSPKLDSFHAQKVKELISSTGKEYKTEYFEDIEQLLFRVRCGIGVALMVGNSVAHEECGIVTLPIKEDVTPRCCTAIWRKDLRRTNVSSFISLLKESYS